MTAAVSLIERKKKPASLKGTMMQELFVMHYVACKGNGTEAAKRAGYSAHTAHVKASQLMARQEIREAVVKLAWKTVENMQVDGQMVLNELASIAFAPITPGYVSASDKRSALQLLGTHLKLWEGSRGDRIIQINITELDLSLA
jgi:hypothetical protein